MPTNPVSPNTEAAIDRLTLGIESPRGTQPSMIPGGCMCFEAEASWIGNCSMCFEAEASVVFPGMGQCGCFEGE